MYLALRNVIAKWDVIQHWKDAMNRFQIDPHCSLYASLPPLPVPNILTKEDGTLAASAG